MAENLVMTAYPYCPAAIVVFDRAVDALGCATLVVADFFGGLVTSTPPGQFLRGGFGLAATARIGVDDGHMPKRAAFLPDFRCIIGAVHKIVEAGDAAGGYDGQGDR